MAESPFVIKTEHFEGPLDLLLNLVEKRKVFINDFSLAEIADEYVSYMEELKTFSFKDISNFIVIASTLILIKSKSLLPNLELTLEEEQSIDDLERRLKEYKLIKSLSKYVGNKFGMNIVFSSLAIQMPSTFAPDENMTQNTLFQNVQEVIKNFPKTDKEENPKASIKRAISLEEMLDSLRERIQTNLKTTFREFAGGVSKGEKVNTIVGFLAVLELFKGGVINLTQGENFADIHIESQNVGVPRY